MAMAILLDNSRASCCLSFLHPPLGVDHHCRPIGRRDKRARVGSPCYRVFRRGLSKSRSRNSTPAITAAAGEWSKMPPTSIVSKTNATSIACGAISLPSSTGVRQLNEKHEATGGPGLWLPWVSWLSKNRAHPEIQIGRNFDHQLGRVHAGMHLPVQCQHGGRCSPPATLATRFFELVLAGGPFLDRVVGGKEECVFVPSAADHDRHVVLDKSVAVGSNRRRGYSAWPSITGPKP